MDVSEVSLSSALDLPPPVSTETKSVTLEHVPLPGSATPSAPIEAPAEFVDPFPDEPYCTNSLPPYTFDPALSTDENIMVHTLIYARLSVSRRGNMAALVVAATPSPSSEASTKAEVASPPLPHILVHSNNTPLPSPTILPHQKHPELHAEARCISLAARQGIPLAGSTIYVSFPPCASCLQLIVGAGITRAVFRRRLLGEENVALAREEGVELVEVTEYEKDEELKTRANEWWAEHGETKERAKARAERWWRSQGPAFGSHATAARETGAEGEEGERGAKLNETKRAKRKREKLS